MNTEIKLLLVKRTYPKLLRDMSVHYSKPKGFVGRNLCYAIYWRSIYMGAIVAGSATRHLPGRANFYNEYGLQPNLNNLVNNIFFHIEPLPHGYPERNFAQTCLRLFRDKVITDWLNYYGDCVLGFETLVELPRTGEIYLRDKWKVVGQTKGYTCKRVAGQGTDSWTGARVWDTVNLRPKIVLCRLP